MGRNFNSLFLSLITSLTLTSCLNHQKADISNNSVQIVSGNTVYSGTSFYYFDLADRVEILNSLFSGIEKDYALLEVKQRNIGLDYSKVKSDAFEAERAYSDVSLSDEELSDSYKRTALELKQAQSNLAFYDRVKKIIAAFKDTHFSLRLSVPTNAVGLPFDMYSADGKYYVRGVDKKLLSLAAKLNYEAYPSFLKPGAEVKSIDGVSVKDAAEELAAYENASSTNFGEMRSLRALTYRNYKYPQKNNAVVEFTDGEKIILPWVYYSSGGNIRRDALTYLNAVKIPSAKETVGATYNESSNEWTLKDPRAMNGYTADALPKNVIEKSVYVDDSGEEALRTGLYLKNGKAYAVIQLLTFSTINLKKDNDARPFIDVIGNFVKYAKEQNLDIIFDIRNNGGGNGNFPSKVLSLLAAKDDRFPNHTRSMALTPFARQLTDSSEFISELGLEETTNSISSDYLYDLFNESLSKKLKFSPAYTYSVVEADKSVAGYSGKIVALVSPNCISACDIMSMLLKKSKRATILGSNSNGTGAGYRSTSNLAATWNDPFRLYKTTFPNFLFGYPEDQIYLGVSETPDSTLVLNSENRPVMADVFYDTQLDDILNNNKSWYEKAISILEGN